MLNLGETFPNFQTGSTLGPLDFYEYLGNSWGVVFSHPADFTPVCTTEIARMSSLWKEFESEVFAPYVCRWTPLRTIVAGSKVINDLVKLFSTNWPLIDVKHVSGCQVPFPLVGDPDGKISEQIGMLDKSVDKRITVRGVFVIGPDKKVKAVICYPTTTGRNFDEILRLIDSLQLTHARPDVVTPVDWTPGDDLIVRPGFDIEGQSVVQLPSNKPYLRYVKH